MFYWPLGWYSSYCAAQLVTGSTDVPEAYNLSQLQNTNHCISWGVNFSFRPLIKLLNGRIFNLYNKYSILLADPVFWGFVQAFLDVASIGDRPTMGREICKFKTCSLWGKQADSARADCFTHNKDALWTLAGMIPAAIIYSSSINSGVRSSPPAPHWQNGFQKLRMWGAIPNDGSN